MLGFYPLAGAPLASDGAEGATVQGAAKFDGAGLLKSNALVVKWGAAKFDGAGSLKATSLVVKWGAAKLDGAGGLLAAATHTPAGAAKFDGAGGVAAQATHTPVGAAKLDGSGALIAQATHTPAGAAKLDGSGALVAQATHTPQGEALLDGAGLLKTNALLHAAGAAILVGEGALRADGQPLRLEQRHYRFRTDALAVDAAPTWGAGEDGTFDPGAQPFRLRIAVRNPLAFPWQAQSIQLYCSKNAGAYQPVTASSTFGVKSSAAASASADETALKIPRLTVG